ncbi:MAG: hypothetical protein ABSD28_16040 [Tepidisphaeraceae bacterium]
MRPLTMLMLDEFQTAVMVRGLTDAGDALDDVNAHGAEGEASAAAVRTFARWDF